MRKKRAGGLFVGLASGALLAAACGGGNEAPANRDTSANANTTNVANAAPANANQTPEAQARHDASPSPSLSPLPSPVTSGEGSVEGALAEVDSFTSELLKRIEGAKDAGAGLAEAQKFFDARAGQIRARVLALRAGAQSNAEARRKLLESEVDNSGRVSNLQTRFLDRSMRDARFKTKLDKLVSDYRELFKE